MVRRLAELLLSGAIMNTALQPHEAHIPYVLQVWGVGREEGRREEGRERGREREGGGGREGGRERGGRERKREREGEKDGEGEREGREKDVLQDIGIILLYIVL